MVTCERTSFTKEMAPLVSSGTPWSGQETNWKWWTRRFWFPWREGRGEEGRGGRGEEEEGRGEKYASEESEDGREGMGGDSSVPFRALFIDNSPLTLQTV